MSNPYTQLFRGTTSLAKYPGHAYQEVFKLQNVEAEPEVTEITIPDPTRMGLPELDGVTSTSAINISGESVNLSPAALAILAYGSVDRVPAGTVTDEAQQAYVDGIIALAHMPLAITEVTDDAGATTYVSGIDYVQTPGGLRVLPGGDLAEDIAATTAGAGERKRLPVKVTYSYPEVDLVKLYTTGRQFFRVMFEQVNEGGLNEKRVVKCRYARISINGALPLNQGAEFGVIPVSIKLLPDPAIIEAGEAAIWYVEQQVKE